MKIVRRSHAKSVTFSFVSSNPQDTQGIPKMFWADSKSDRPCIQLWDYQKTNCIMVFLGFDMYRSGGSYKVAFIDTVNGLESISYLYLSQIYEKIWEHHNYINKSGQLTNL